MGSTPRPHRYAIPMATRSTDVSTLAQCEGSWLLKLFYEKEQAEASFFILGSQLHETIEVAIVMDLDLDGAQRHLNAALDRELERVDASGKRRIESSKRGFDTMHEDGERMLGNWFRSVHPDSAKRHPIYDGYEWPPETEVGWRRNAGTTHPIWGSIDAVFLHKTDLARLALVDWKSSTSKQRDSNQLHYYMYGYGHMPNDEAWFHHLDRVRNDAIIQMADPYPGDDVVRQRILDTEAAKQRILEGEVTFTPDWYCGYCPVQEFCPADGDVRNREDNQRKLDSMVQLARPMVTIEREATNA